MKSFILFLLTAFALTACSAADSSTEPTSSVSQALTPVTVTMNVAPGTVCRTSPAYCIANEDPIHPTAMFIAATLLTSTVLHSTFNASGHTAILIFTAADYTTAASVINAPGTHTITVTYDNDTVGNTKAVIGSPTIL